MARPALAATRALEVLNFMAADASRAYSLSELVQHLGLNIASLHAVLNVLTRQGYLARHPKHKTYSLGTALVALGHAALESHPAIDRARDEARDLSQQLELEVLVMAEIGQELVALARAGRFLSPNASLRVGQRVPMMPPLGAAFVAWGPEKRVAAWLDAGAIQAGSDMAGHLTRVLEAVRRRGYAVTLANPVGEKLGHVVASLSDTPRQDALRDSMARLIGELGTAMYALGEAEPGARYPVTLISAPVFNAFGAVEYTLSLMGFAEDLTVGQIEQYARRLIASCLLVTRQSNGRLPEDAPQAGVIGFRRDAAAGSRRSTG